VGGKIFIFFFDSLPFNEFLVKSIPLKSAIIDLSQIKKEAK
jgi:hypothetical protein